MKCTYCEGEMTRGAAPFHIDREAVHVSLDRVPAWVCPQCGEFYFEEHEVDSIQALVKVIEEQSQDFAKTG